MNGLSEWTRIATWQHGLCGCDSCGVNFIRNLFELWLCHRGWGTVFFSIGGDGVLLAMAMMEMWKSKRTSTREKKST